MPAMNAAQDNEDRDFWRRLVEVTWARADRRETEAAAVRETASPGAASLGLPSHGSPMSMSQGTTILDTAGSVVSRSPALNGDALSPTTNLLEGPRPLGLPERNVASNTATSAWLRLDSCQDAAPSGANIAVVADNKPAASPMVTNVLPAFIEIEDEEDETEDDLGASQADSCNDKSATARNEKQVPDVVLLEVDDDEDGELAQAEEAEPAEGEEEIAGKTCAGAEFFQAFEDMPEDNDATVQQAVDQLHPRVPEVRATSALQSPRAQRTLTTSPASTSALKSASLRVPVPPSTPPPQALAKVSNAPPLKRSEKEAWRSPFPKVATGMPQQFTVDNRLLQAKTVGLGFRFAKQAHNLDKTSTAAWGSVISGVDEGDGWVRVGEKYLPMEVKGKQVLFAKVPLARTTSGTLFSALPKTAGFGGFAAPTSKTPGFSIAASPVPEGLALKRQNSSPAGRFLPRAASFNGDTGSDGGAHQLRRQNSNPAGVFVPRSQSSASLGETGLKRQASGLVESGDAPVDKKAVPTDPEGRRFNLNTVIVNFANVGATYGVRVLGRQRERGESLFDWEGIRKCVHHLKLELNLEVIGVIHENFGAFDNSTDYRIGIPEDIRALCDSIEETPKLQGRNHKSADDEMTIKCAYRRNCRFLDNDNYRDWKREMRNESIRNWLSSCAEILHMKYFFDAQEGTFDTLDGHIPESLLRNAR